MQKNKRNTNALVPLICPYCHASLVRREQWLVCRYHKIGFEILSHGVNFQWHAALRKGYEDLMRNRPL